MSAVELLLSALQLPGGLIDSHLLYLGAVILQLQEEKGAENLYIYALTECITEPGAP